jgi:hypothetical protein
MRTQVRSASFGAVRPHLSSRHRARNGLTARASVHSGAEPGCGSGAPRRTGYHSLRQRPPVRRKHSSASPKGRRSLPPALKCLHPKGSPFHRGTQAPPPKGSPLCPRTRAPPPEESPVSPRHSSAFIQRVPPSDPGTQAPPPKGSPLSPRHSSASPQWDPPCDPGTRVPPPKGSPLLIQALKCLFAKGPPLFRGTSPPPSKGTPFAEALKCPHEGVRRGADEKKSSLRTFLATGDAGVRPSVQVRRPRAESAWCARKESNLYGKSK